MFHRAAGVDKSNPLLDMFQILNLTKRVDGAEEGISKLASMIEDLAREGPGNSVREIDSSKYKNWLRTMK